jgi:Cu2+-containing amine oxidase
MKAELKQLQEMLDMQTKLVVNLELEKIELEKGIKNACQYSHENLEKVVELTDKVKQLETDKEELHEIIKALTNNKLPCNPDHNGECLVCDNWLCDCPLQQNDLPTI